MNRDALRRSPTERRPARHLHRVDVRRCGYSTSVTTPTDAASDTERSGRSYAGCVTRIGASRLAITSGCQSRDAPIGSADTEVGGSMVNQRCSDRARAYSHREVPETAADSPIHRLGSRWTVLSSGRAKIQTGRSSARCLSASDRGDAPRALALCGARRVDRCWVVSSVGWSVVGSVAPSS